jgi:hypothetical protein
MKCREARGAMQFGCLFKGIPIWQGGFSDAAFDLRGNA